jgi:hypothetical protein
LDWNDEAAKWYALNDDIPIMLEDTSLDTLIGRVKLATPELLELNGKPHLQDLFDNQPSCRQVQWLNTRKKSGRFFI